MIFALLIANDGFWTVIAIAVWAYCFWVLILQWKDAPPPETTPETVSDPVTFMVLVVLVGAITNSPMERISEFPFAA